MTDVTSCSYFEDNSIESGESVTKDSEKAIVHWLFSNDIIWSSIIKEFVSYNNDKEKSAAPIYLPMVAQASCLWFRTGKMPVPPQDIFKIA